MAAQSTIGNPQTGTTAPNEFAKLRREQKLDVDKITRTRSHLEKLHKKELNKDPDTRRELTVVPKWRRREHPANSRDTVRFGPDRVCQAVNPREEGPCRCTPCRRLEEQMRSFCFYSKESTICFDKRKRVGGTTALPTVAVDRWVEEDFDAPESRREDESGPYTAEEEGDSPRLHPTEVNIWDLVKPAKPRSQKQKGEYHLQGNMDANAQRLCRMVDARSSAL